MLAIRRDSPASPKVLYTVSLGGLLLCLGVASVPLIADVPTVAIMGLLLPLALAFMLVNAAVIVSMLRACRLAAASLERSAGRGSDRRRTDPLSRLVDAVETLDQAMTERTGEIERLRHVDPLTGIGNRRWLQLVAARVVEEAASTGATTSLIVVRVDHLTAINETFGYEVGDATLLAVSDALRRQLRRDDCIARTSGKEFAVLLPGVAQAATEIVATRLSEAMRATPLPMVGEDALPVRIGMAEWKNDHQVEAVMARAQALIDQQPRGPVPGGALTAWQAPGRAAGPAYAAILSQG